MQRQTTTTKNVSALTQVLDGALTQSGATIIEMSKMSPVLLVFLRYAGCTFCRETLVDIARLRRSIEEAGIRIVLVHQGDESAILKLLAKHGLADLQRICDRGRALYRAFGLKRGVIFRLFGWTVLRRGLMEGALFDYGFGFPQVDPTQMPGVFLIDDCEISRRFRHRSPADRPDYLALIAAASAVS